MFSFFFSTYRHQNNWKDGTRRKAVVQKAVDPRQPDRVWGVFHSCVPGVEPHLCPDVPARILPPAPAQRDVGYCGACSDLLRKESRKKMPVESANVNAISVADRRFGIPGVAKFVRATAANEWFFGTR